MLLVLIIFLNVKVVVPAAKYRMAYARGDRSEKLILYYRHRMRKRRKDKELVKCVNYREQTECLYDRRREAGVPDTSVMEYKEPVRENGYRVDPPPMEELIRVLETAGFSGKEISQEEFDLAKQRLDELLIRVKKGGNNSEK